MRRFATTVALLMLTAQQHLTAQQPDLFPFVVSYDTPDNATNIAPWLDKPAGKQGPIRVEQGHLATDAGPIRLWAVNLCFDACFPEPQQAERIAQRLARLGVNCVRMHHMDNRNIWGKSENKTIIDPPQLQRLDYLIYQLKQAGIYTNLNLHVSRTLGPKEGFDNLPGRPKYDKGLDNFEPRMIALQKQYAHDLLTHVNPYTELAYTEDPAIAFVEINNENALYDSWKRDMFAELPDPYQTTFRTLWNEWLRNKYQSTSALRAAWQVGAEPLGGELLVNGDFSQPLESHWRMERDDQTDVSWQIDPQGRDGHAVLGVQVVRAGSVSWRPQFSNASFELRKGKPYTLSFWARAENPGSVSVHAMMNHDPWQRVGLATQVKVDTTWQRYQLTFVASANDANTRLTFSQLAPNQYQFSQISLQTGGIQGLQDGESLERRNVALLQQGRLDRTPQAGQDFAQFLWDTERDYWGGMREYLKQELGVKALVSGTQLGYSPVHLQAAFDYLDAHAYWQHPSFPGQPWDSRNWYIRNIALVSNPSGTLGSLAARRVVGKPYTISEYNHPVPNRYAAEGFPMIAAFGALQHWDGVYIFSYSHNRDHEPQKVSSYFDIKGDATRLVHMPACHALFVRGDMAGARKLLSTPLSAQKEMELLGQNFDPRTLVTDTLGLNSLLSLKHAIGVDLTPAAAAPDTYPAPSETGKYQADTGQMTWDNARTGGGVFLVNTERTKVFTGFARDETFRLGEVQLTVGATRLGWATVSLVCLDGKGFSSAGRILVAATGWMQNSNAQLQQLADDRVTYGAQWGDAPLLCEGVPAKLTLPVTARRLRGYVLDEAGNRRAPLPVSASGERAVVDLSPTHKTLWYELVIQ